jgi:phage protein D
MPDGASPVGLVAAAPLLEIGGEERPELTSQLLSLGFEEDREGLGQLEAQFGNWGETGGQVGFRYFDRALFDFGQEVKLRLGREVLFEGRISALEARFPEASPPTLTILAEDRLQDLRMTRRSRSFEQVSDADLFARIAREHGLEAQVDIPGPTHALLAQANQSDLAFLRDRARAVDADLWVTGRTLHASSRRSREAGRLTLEQGARLRSFTVTADLAGQRSAAIATGWDVAGKQAIRHEATPGILAPELRGDTSGPAVLERAFGARKEQVAHAVPLTAAEAQARAEAVLRMAARRFVTGRGTAEADAALRVGAAVELQGLGPIFSGRYVLAEVRHRYDQEKGMRTEFLAERPGLGGMA